MAVLREGLDPVESSLGLFLAIVDWANHSTKAAKFGFFSRAAVILDCACTRAVLRSDTARPELLMQQQQAIPSTASMAGGCWHGLRLWYTFRTLKAHASFCDN
jgi:hypothetical protein